MFLYNLAVPQEKVFINAVIFWGNWSSGNTYSQIFLRFVEPAIFAQKYVYIFPLPMHSHNRIDVYPDILRHKIPIMQRYFL